MRWYQLVILVLVLGVAGAQAASNAAIEKLQADVLARYKGAPPAAIIQVLGAPPATDKRDGKEYLTWEAAGSEGTVVNGYGASGSYSCRATFEFVNNGLAKVSLFGAGGGDRTLCKHLMKPLLGQSEPQPSSPSETATDAKAATGTSGAALTNADIVKLTAAGLPDSVILAKIGQSRCNFDLSTDGLVSLKQAGVRDPIIDAMMGVAAKKPVATEDSH
jgi:hypothetical protein